MYKNKLSRRVVISLIMCTQGYIAKDDFFLLGMTSMTKNFGKHGKVTFWEGAYQ